MLIAVARTEENMKNYRTYFIAFSLAIFVIFGLSGCNKQDEHLETESQASLAASAATTERAIYSSEVITSELATVVKPIEVSTEAVTSDFSTELITSEPPIETVKTEKKELEIKANLLIYYDDSDDQINEEYTIRTTDYFEGEIYLEDFLTAKDENGMLLYGYTGIDVEAIAEDVRVLCADDDMLRFKSYSGDELTLFVVSKLDGQVVFEGGVFPGEDGYTFLIFEMKMPTGGRVITAFENDRSRRVNFLVWKMTLEKNEL